MHTKKESTSSCPCCQAEHASVFFEIEDVPVHSVLNFRNKQDAIDYPRGEIRLGFCHDCEFIFNVAFDPGLHEYSPDYEETQKFSRTFRSFSRTQAEALIEKYNLYEKTVVEIGCGKGDFLTDLCRLGKNRGIGFDPAFVAERADLHDDDNVTFIPDFYSEKYMTHECDFLCCKMTLEHIPNPFDFVSVIRSTFADNSETMVYFQVPNVNRILQNGAFEDIYYEHCSYFSPDSIAKLFLRCGFEILDVRTIYADQYLTIEAKPTQEARTKVGEDKRWGQSLAGLISSFHQKLETKKRLWGHRFSQLKEDNCKVVLWGSGSKGVTFLTFFKQANHITEYVVDVNPYRQGTFMAGTGQEIVGPEFLRDLRPDCVIIMNSIYRSEILADLRKMNLTPELLVLE